MKAVLLFVSLCVASSGFTQTSKSSKASIEEIINAKEAERIERVLSADEMQGRKAGTEGNSKAAQFISDEFKKAGLQTWGNASSYLQEFTMVQPKFLEVKGELDDEVLDPKKIIVFTTKKELEVDEQSGYEYKTIVAGSSLVREAYSYINANKKLVVFVDASYSNDFGRLTRFKGPTFASDNSVIFLLTNNNSPKKFKIKAKHELKEVPMANIVGILPGKTKPQDYVVFSAHYDHLGIGKPLDSDSIYNGANDDAAGTTAVILLANYFKKAHNNERTLVFVAFTAEEIGGFGSQYFSKQFDPEQVVAMFNIEMIGTESKWGRNSAFITGFEKSDMGKILQQNLEGSSFNFYPDPYPAQQLFYRSDNATLASLGVPAHTISTSKMDEEKNYHTVNDEIETLNLENMAAIVRAIALSSTTIIQGKATPTRVSKNELN